MIIAKVLGTVVATVKDPGFEGKKLVIVQSACAQGGATDAGEYDDHEANDDLEVVRRGEGSGGGEPQGSCAAMAPEHEEYGDGRGGKGLIDRIDANGQVVFRKG